MWIYFKLFPGQKYVEILVLLHSCDFIENVHSEIFDFFNWEINMLNLKSSYAKIAAIILS